MSETSKPVTCRHEAEGLAVVMIDRPERRNALNLEIKQCLSDIVETLEQDEEVRVIVITGAGRYFVAGTDIAEMATMTSADHARLKTDRMFRVLRESSKILIAAVEGYALGGGCELALCCDMIVAGAGAHFGQPEIRVGIMPGAGATQRLVRAAGRYRAMKMVLTGEHVQAPDALTMGMISEVVADGQALEAALTLGHTVAGMPRASVAAIKEVMRLGPDAPLETALALERKAFMLLFDGADQKEGMRAFLEKRPPVWSNG